MAQEFEKRLHWLGEICSFLRRNQVMWQVSLEARQRLLVDLQIVSCGAGLWTFLNAKGRLRYALPSRCLAICILNLHLQHVGQWQLSLILR